jgi:hypothetical protein
VGFTVGLEVGEVDGSDDGLAVGGEEDGLEVG